MREEEQLIDLLKKKNWTITTVESCTGGAISARIVDIPGASDVLKEAFVTYCDEAKHTLVGVSSRTLERFTAVSRETAEEMALGGAERAKADVALSATGIAGPGGTEEFPAGLVYLSCAVHGAAVTRKFLFSGSRNEVRAQAVQEALRLGIAVIKVHEEEEEEEY